MDQLSIPGICPYEFWLLPPGFTQELGDTVRNTTDEFVVMSGLVHDHHEVYGRICCLLPHVSVMPHSKTNNLLIENATRSYSLALAPTGAPLSRPALSATCYSNLPSPTTVIAYDNVTITATQPYNDPTAQAFALAIDGLVDVDAAEYVSEPVRFCD